MLSSHKYAIIKIRVAVCFDPTCWQDYQSKSWFYCFIDKSPFQSRPKPVKAAEFKHLSAYKG